MGYVNDGFSESSEAEEYEFYVKGLDSSYLETWFDTIQMNGNNRAFVLDVPANDSIEWAFYTGYLGGSISFDVNVNDVGCGCAAGVYLTALDDDTCSWSPYPMGDKPQCSSIDVMEANRNGFTAAAHPCEGSECDLESQSKNNVNDHDAMSFGPGNKYTINTKKNFNVRTQFYAGVDEDGWYTDL